MKPSCGGVTLFVMPRDTPEDPTQCILTSRSNRMADEEIAKHLSSAGAQPGCLQPLRAAPCAAVMRGGGLRLITGPTTRSN